MWRQGRLSFDEFAQAFNRMHDYLRYKLTHDAKTMLGETQGKFTVAASRRVAMGDVISGGASFTCPFENVEVAGGSLPLTANAHDFGVEVLLPASSVGDACRAKWIRAETVSPSDADHIEDSTDAMGMLLSPTVSLEFEGRSARLLPGAAEALLAVAAHADVHIVTTLPEDSDELEDSALRAMESSGLFGASVCDRRKAIFCSTEDGRGAMCRQLAPACHIDTSPKILQYLAPHVGSVVYIDAAARQLDNIRGSLSVVRSLAEYAQAYRTATAGGA